MRRKPINAYKIGKRQVEVRGMTINTTIYIDEKGMFCMVKGERLNIREQPKYKALAEERECFSTKVPPACYPRPKPPTV